MLRFDPARRASVKECLAHPFLARVREARRGVELAVAKLLEAGAARRAQVSAAAAMAQRTARSL
jgi:hypothetical protein